MFIVYTYLYVAYLDVYGYRTVIEIVIAHYAPLSSVPLSGHSRSYAIYQLASTYG